MMRWLGGLGIGLVPIADAASFSWAGPWIGWVRRPGGDARRAVVMYWVPSGVVWDPSGITETEGWQLDGGFAVSALDIALARPPLPKAPSDSGTVEAIYIAPAAGAPAQRVENVRALAGSGLDGDRHVAGRGTFPSDMPGSALTLIEAEVCVFVYPFARRQRTPPQRGHPWHRSERLGRPRVPGRHGSLPWHAAVRAMHGHRALRVASRPARARTPRRPARRHFGTRAPSVSCGYWKSVALTAPTHPTHGPGETRAASSPMSSRVTDSSARK